MTRPDRIALLLINPKSRRGADEDLSAGLELLHQAGIRVLQKEPRSADHMAQLLREHRGQVDFFILGGGDGTISTAAPVLYECGKPFAVIPLGTANDLARSLDITGGVEEACRVIVEGHRRRIDLGMVNDHYFFNVAHIGLGVHVTYELTPEVKKRWGVFSYLHAFSRALSRTRSFRVRLSVDGREYRQKKSIHIAVGNGRFYGGGNVVDERARIDSGELCLYSLKPQSLWELLTLAPLLRSGRQRRAKRTFTAVARHIEIRTSQREEIHADGEPAGFTPAVFRVLPQALEVYAAAPVEAGETPATTIATREVSAA
jgi:diacylglycerol kinase (ATP)